MSQKTKVLIIGAKGNLGQELVKIFSADEKYEVIGWDKEEINITNRERVAEKIAEEASQIIINAAAYNAVDNCEEPAEFEIAKKINGEAVGFLAEAAKKSGAIMIHYSTDNVFDGKKEDGYTEDDEPNPVSCYAETKYLGEKLLQKNTDRYYLIRTSRIFGRPGSSETSKESFIDLMFRLGRERESLEVVDEESSCFTYAPDLAKATKELIKQKKPFGVYHITNSGAYTWYSAAVNIFGIAGIDVRVIPIVAEKFTRPAKRPKYSILLNTKLPPLRSFEEALKEYLSVA